MISKKRIEFRSPLRALDRSPLRDYLGSRELPFFLVRRNLFSRFFIFSSLTGLAMVSSFFSRTGLILFLALLAFAVYQYLTLRKVIGIFEADLVCPERAREYDQITVKILMKSVPAAGWGHGALSIHFTGSKISHRGQSIFQDTLKLSRKSESEILVKYKCDSGMGLHELGPIELTVTDSLGLFEFNIHFESKKWIFILPRIEEVPELPIAGRKDSLLYGIYDVAQRGASVNFAGIRDYERGDSIRQIAWRLSAKQGRLVVKDFEKSVNADITIWMDLDPTHQVGTLGQNTWEPIKDLSLAIASSQLQINNRVQVASQNLFLPFGMGQEHAHFIALKVATHQLSTEKKYSDFLDIASVVPSGSMLFVVMPIFPDLIKETVQKIMKLREIDLQPVCVFVDSLSMIGADFKTGSAMSILGPLNSTWHECFVSIKRLRSIGIPVYLHSGDQSFMASLANEASVRGVRHAS